MYGRKIAIHILMPQMIYSMVIKRVASGVSAIVGSLLFLFCCDCSNQQRHHGDAKVLSVELKHQDVNLEDLFERVEIIPLETNDSCLITKIVAAISTAAYYKSHRRSGSGSW